MTTKEEISYMEDRLDAAIVLINERFRYIVDDYGEDYRKQLFKVANTAWKLARHLSFDYTRAMDCRIAALLSNILDVGNVPIADITKDYGDVIATIIQRVTVTPTITHGEYIKQITSTPATMVVAWAALTETLAISTGHHVVCEKGLDSMMCKMADIMMLSTKLKLAAKITPPRAKPDLRIVK